MKHREQFYRERDRRTVEYGVSNVFDEPVGLVVGNQAATCVRGQLATLATVNMLARIHRNLRLQIPSVPLLRPSLARAMTLDAAAAELALEADPFIRLSGDLADVTTTIGLGADALPGLTWYVGSERQVATLDKAPVAFDQNSTPSLGAGLAACMGAGAVLRSVLGLSVRPARVCAWTLTEGNDCGGGPSDLGTLNVGDVLQIGAGGVGACFTYWLREFGSKGHWCVMDGDDTELHNTNRSLCLFPSHAGWASNTIQKKAAVTAALMGGEPIPSWYDEFDFSNRTFDLVLPLANDRAVRHLIACRGEPILLHATTSKGWEAQLHRHVPDRDDCITCRMPSSQAAVQLECATVPLQRNAEGSTDAALPFLSAAAGLLLLGGLFRLQEGDFLDEQFNGWSLCFNDVRRHVRHALHSCQAGCATTVSAAARRRIHAGRRWSSIDVSALKLQPN